MVRRAVRRVSGNMRWQHSLWEEGGDALGCGISGECRDVVQRSSGVAVGVIRWAVGGAAAAVVVTYFVSSCCVHLGVGHGAGASAMYGGGTCQRVVSRVCVLRV